MRKWTALALSLLVFLSMFSIAPFTGHKAYAASGGNPNLGPFTIYEYLPAPGQFSNTYLMSDPNAEWNNNLSKIMPLGAFGGYVIFKMDEPIVDSPLHPYGVDFNVYGNAFTGFMEPGAIAVAQDDGTGKPGTWYHIAGSEHYEDATIWDYKANYTNPDPDFAITNGINIPWTDNQGNTGEIKTNNYNRRPYYPIPDNYPLKPADFTNTGYSYSGVNINVRDNAFGYADSHSMGNGPYDVLGNPYAASAPNGDPIDIAWAVDEDGKPANLESVDFIKVYTAVQIDGGAFGEVSTEVSGLIPAKPVSSETGVTDDLNTLSLSSTTPGALPQIWHLTPGQYVYDDIVVNADSIKITANGDAANIYVNNTRGTANAPVNKVLTLSDSEPRLVRVIAQDGDKQPVIYYLSLRKGKVAKPSSGSVDVAVESAARQILNKGVTSDWEAAGLARAGYTVPEKYYNKLIERISQANGNFANVTDYERLSLAITALGYDATNFAAHNLIEKIYNFNNITAQGVNGPIYGLIALDSGGYTIPNDAKWNRNSLIDKIIEYKNPDGGYGYAGTTSTPDMTAMALIALAPYMDQEPAKTAGELAVQWLSAQQQPHGGYDDSSESVAQAIIALTAAGFDPTDTDYTKDGESLVSRLLSFRKADGGYSHKLSDSSSNAFSTEQALQALVAYQLYTENNGRLYDYTQTELPGVEFGVTVNTVIQGPEGQIYQGTAHGVTAMDALLQAADANNIAVGLAGGGTYVTSIQGIEQGLYGGYDGWMYVVKRDNQWVMPQVGMADFDLDANDQLLIYYGEMDTQLVQSVTLSPAQPKAGEAFTVSVNQWTWDWVSNEDLITPAEGATVTIAGVSAVTDNSGVASFTGGIPAAGSYEAVITHLRENQGPALVRDTRPVTIQSANVEPVTRTVTLSVVGDSQKGTIVSNKTIELADGDTAFSVLLRELGSKVVYSGSGPSIYVSAIDGLAEFDRGPKSGWMFAVNGIYPEVSAGIYTLKDKDRVTWNYTVNLGQDLNAGMPDTPSAISKELEQAFGQLSIKADNTLPIGQTVRTTEVLNRSNAMSKQQVEELLKALQAGLVSVSKTTSTDKETVISDSLGEAAVIVPAGATTGPLTISIQELKEQRPGLATSLFEFTPKDTVFGKAVYVQFKVPVQTANPDDLVICWLNERTGEWIPIPSVLDLKTGLITGKVTHFTKFAVIDRSKLSTPRPTFTDESLISSWALEAVHRVFEAKVMVGVSDTELRFAPKQSMTRAEFAKLIVNLLNETPAAEAKQIFKDVKPSSWYYGSVMKAQELGIIQGISATEFKPDQAITRQEMAIMIARAFKLSGGTAAVAYKDQASISPSALEAVQAVSSQGIMTGSGGFFSPKSPVTREMAAVVADKLLTK
ncbi:S-layer homology domain-containing protein [Paenibacillus sp. NPDC058174]|uniref:S-layer homology domain-containing protein n=1 Tax=Paenibacillus sp. NPDC058174 TaxID=3346366 RepID=UPI0036D84F76